MSAEDHSPHAVPAARIPNGAQSIRTPTTHQSRSNEEGRTVTAKDTDISEASRSPRSKPTGVFASPATRGHHPYWGQCIMRTFIRPTALKVGISKQIGWHTFRHTYSSLLRQNGTDIKVTQELLRQMNRDDWSCDLAERSSRVIAQPRLN